MSHCGGSAENQNKNSNLFMVTSALLSLAGPISAKQRHILPPKADLKLFHFTLFWQSPSNNRFIEIFSLHKML
jgi:hypothetical protein